MADRRLQRLQIGIESTPGRAATPPPRSGTVENIDEVIGDMLRRYNVPADHIFVHPAALPALEHLAPPVEPDPPPAPSIRALADQTVTAALDAARRALGVRSPSQEATAGLAEAVRRGLDEAQPPQPARPDQVVEIQVSAEWAGRSTHHLTVYLQAQARAAFGPDYTPVEITELPSDRLYNHRYRVRGRYTGPPAPVRLTMTEQVRWAPGAAAGAGEQIAPGAFNAALADAQARMLGALRFDEENRLVGGGRVYGRDGGWMMDVDGHIRYLNTAADPAALAAAEQARAERQRRQQEEHAAREAANARAKALLESLLTPDQRAQFAAEHQFELTGNLGRRYRIETGNQGNVWELDSQGRPLVQWCAAPESRSGVPIWDSMAAQLLHLRHDEAGFRAVANRLRTLDHSMGWAVDVTDDRM